MQKSAQVLVVGAGPVGAVAAYRLAQMGVDVILLEGAQQCPEDLRASTFHPPTLDMMKELGIFEELDVMGLRAPVYQYRDRQTDEVFSFDLSELSDEMQFPFRLQCEQFKLARLLAEKLSHHRHGAVHFSHRVVYLEQDETGVTVYAETPMDIQKFRVDYVIAADGASSITRKWLGTSFEGFTYPEKFVTYSTQVPLERYFDGLAQVNYVADPDEWMVLLKVPSVWRVLVPAREGEDADLVSDARVRDVFSRLIGEPDVKTEHRTIYRVHQRVAESYYENRVILAGDAAHLNNPLGGFGMNSGIHDVWNLTSRMPRMLFDGADPKAELSHYQRQRQTVMRTFVQQQTVRNKKQLESRDEAAREAHRQEMRNMMANEELRRNYLRGQAMYGSLRQEAEID